MAAQGKEAAEVDAARLELGEDFAKAECLVMAEVAQRMRDRAERQAQDGGPAAPTHLVTKKAQLYAERFAKGFSPAAAHQVKADLAAAGLEPFEVAVVANLLPDDAETAESLQPSITSDPGELQAALDKIGTLQY